ncbi:MAG: sensor histidine kinase [Lachnospiraceae bacterium]|nr:sensor histidine kinase [Lachnospiraceae bacterium]
MKFLRYIKEHLWLCAAFLFVALTADIFLLTFKGALWLILYISSASLIACFICYLVGYLRTKKMFDEIEDKIEAMDKKYLVPEVLDERETQEAELIFEILKKAEVSMSDNVAGYRHETEEYRDYVESWVHEIKIPISAAQMICENHKDTPLRESGISEELDRIEGNVEQALYYARSSYVEKDYFIKEINASELVKSAVAKRRRSLIAMRAKIENLINGDEVICSDAKWLAFILGQLIDNSIKYAKEDEGLILTFSLEEAEGRKALLIKDNGVGIKSAETGRVFDKGFTGSNGRAGKASTGIGLYLCRKLCLRLGHDMMLTSEEGKGTCVRILF